VKNSLSIVFQYFSFLKNKRKSNSTRLLINYFCLSFFNAFVACSTLHEAFHFFFQVFGLKASLKKSSLNFLPPNICYFCGKKSHIFLTSLDILCLFAFELFCCFDFFTLAYKSSYLFAIKSVKRKESSMLIFYLGMLAQTFGLNFFFKVGK